MAPTRKLAELFYTVRARTEGLQGDLNAAERQFGKLADFVKANPVAAITALGVAVAGVALKAVKMASEVETSLRRVANAVPNGIQGLDQLREGIASVARETGKSQAELAHNLQDIARLGVEGPEAAVARLKAIQTAVDATGEEFNSVMEGLDQTLDLFGGSSEDAARALGTLFAAAKGRTSLSDLFAELKAAAPAINKLKLDLDTAARALVALGEQGLSAKQAASELNKLADSGEAGRAAIEKLAASIPSTADGFTDLTKAANDFNNSVDQLNKRAFNDLQSSLIDLGRKLLPTVAEEFRDLIDIIELLTGAKAKRIKELGLTDLGAKFSESIRKNADVLELQAGGLRNAAKELDQVLANGSTELVATTTEGLRAVAVGLDHLVDIGILKADEIAAARKRLDDATRSAGSGATLRGGQSGVSTGDDLKAQQKAAADARKEVEQLADRLTKLGSVQQQTTGATHLSAAAYADFAAEIAQARAKFPQFAGDLDAMAKQLVALRQAASQFEAAELAHEIDTLLASFTTTTVDDLTLALGELQTRLREKGATEDQIKQITDLEQAFIAARKSSEDLDASLESGRQGAITPLAEMVQLLRQQAEAEQKLADLKDAGAEHDRERKELLEQIAKIQERIKELQDDTEKHTETATVKTRDWLSGMEKVAQVAFGVATALLGADDTLTKMIGSAAQVASGLSDIAKLARDAGGLGKLFGSGAGILSALPAIGSIIGGGAALAALFADSPENKANREAIRQNTEALRKVRDGLVTLASTNAPGADVAKLTQAALSVPTTGKAGQFDTLEAAKQFVQALRQAGLSMEDARKIAKDFGFDIDHFTLEGFRKLQEGLRSLPFDAFAKTFGGQLDALEQKFRLFKIDKPSDQFDALVDLLTNPEHGAPALFGALDNIDTKTEEGRAKAKKVIQDLFQKLLDGTIDPESLGGLNLDQFRDVLDQLFGLLGDSVDHVTSLLEKLNDAFAHIDVDLEIAGITDPVTRAIRRAAAAIANDPRIASALGGLDLANEEQRRQAIAALQQLAEGADDELKQIILELLRSIRDIPDAVNGPDGKGGESVIVSNSARGLTETTGNRMADYLATANIIAREQLEVQRAILDRIAPITTSPVPPALVQPPAFAASLGAGAPVVGGGVSVAVGDIIVSVPPGVVTDQTSLQQFLSGPLPTEFVRKIGEGLARLTRDQLRALGIVVQ